MGKLKKISALSEAQLQVSFLHIITKILFIEEDIVPSQVWLQAEIITNSIDVDHLDFVALSSFLEAKLWTGDKKLYSGLKAAGFQDVLNTTELLKPRKN